VPDQVPEADREALGVVLRLQRKRKREVVGQPAPVQQRLLVRRRGLPRGTVCEGATVLLFLAVAPLDGARQRPGDALREGEPR